MHPRTLSFAVLAALAAPVHAATYTPTRFDDPLPNGCSAFDCSLREAVIAAEATLAVDTIQLAAGGYRLTRTSGTEAQSFDLDITRSLLITGSASGTTITNATGTVGAQSRVVEATGTKLTLRNIGLRGGDVGDGDGGCLRVNGGWVEMAASSAALCHALNGSGAAVRDGGRLVLTNATVYRNTGSGVSLSGSVLEMASSRVFDNTGDRGGGVYVHGDSLSRVIATGTSAISANEASMGGGLMAEWGSDAEVSGPAGGWLVIDANKAIAGAGVFGGMGEVTLQNVALLDNVGSELGGGMYVHGIATKRVRVERNVAYSGAGAYIGCGIVSHDCRVAETSFAGNRATADGGAIRFASGSLLELENVSMYDNSAARGGGIAASGSVTLTHVTSWQDQAPIGASLLIVGSLLPESRARNAALLGGCAFLDGNYLNSQGGNAQISGTPSCSLTAPSDKPALSAGSVGASYGDFGGGMQVVGITSNSTLVNSGLATWCEPFDVRGYLRPATCDIGAFQANATVP